MVHISLIKVILITLGCSLQFGCILGGQKLRLVNLLNRHGDRAPIGPLPEGDPHSERVEEFWPNG